MQVRSRTADLATGTGAALVLFGVVFGVPAALVLLVGWPLPATPPSLDAVVTALRYGQIEPATLVRSLAVMLWVLWAMAVSSIATEVLAVLRGTVARALPSMGPLQRLAGHLVAAIMLLSSVTTRAHAAPPVPAGPPETSVVTSPSEDAADRRPSGRHAGAGHDEATAHPRPAYTVRRRDSLWTIAERTLGDGRRWKEIRALNVDRAQPDGGRLRPGETMIHPGWRLELPADATSGVDRRTVTVEPGDHLWSIADDHLGDGDRWTDVYRANRGRRQPDGARLTDPDVIEPGWVLRLPSAPGDAEPGAGGHRPRQARDHRRRQSHPTDAPHDPHPAPAEPAPVAPLPVTPSTVPTEATGPDRGSSGPPVQAPLSGGDAAATSATRRGPAGTSTEDAAATDVIVVGGVALLAAGLVSMIAHGRRSWLRRRPPGSALEPIDSEAAELERWLRSMADHDLEQRLDRVLRVLAEHFAEHDVAPEIVAVEIGEQVALRLAEPDAAAPPGIAASDGGAVWALAPELEMLTPSPGCPRCVPALVTCGSLPDGALLLANPWHAGVIGVHGTPNATSAALTSWITELASDDAAHGLDIVVIGAHHPLIERLPRVTVAADPVVALDRVRGVIEEEPTPGEAASHLIIVYGDPDTACPPELTAAAEHPRIALTLPGARGAPHRLELDAGRVRLTTLGGWLDAPEWLTPDDWDRFGDLLRQPTRQQTSEQVPSPLLLLTPPGGSAGEPLAAFADDADDIVPAVVNVLGPPLIRAGAELPEVARSLLVYLAVHGGRQDPAVVRSTLWPTGAPAVDLAQAADDINRAVGSGGTAPAVMWDPDGRLLVSDAVTSDIGQFHGLIRRLDHHAQGQQARRMYAALDLVRREPFAEGADWAHAEGLATRTAALVSDIAHRLAMSALTVGDLARASWAVAKGLLANPGCELLHRDRLRIADARGDRAALDEIMRELRAIAEADGGWITPETQELYARLQRSATIAEAPAVPDDQRDAS